MSILIIPTGFQALDEVLCGGLRSGSLTLVAGRPGMGKTSFLSGLAKSGEMMLLDDETAAVENLKALAQTSQKPVVATVGLLRAYEEREDKRPHLSDLPIDLVDAADLVLALYRDSYYHCEDAEKAAGDEILILKNAWGKTGKLPATFDAKSRLWKME